MMHRNTVLKYQRQRRVSKQPSATPWGNDDNRHNSLFLWERAEVRAILQARIWAPTPSLGKMGNLFTIWYARAG